MILDTQDIIQSAKVGVAVAGGFKASFADGLEIWLRIGLTVLSMVYVYYQIQLAKKRAAAISKPNDNKTEN